MRLTIEIIQRGLGCDRMEALCYVNGYEAASKQKAKTGNDSYWLAGWHDWHIENDTGIRS